MTQAPLAGVTAESEPGVTESLGSRVSCSAFDRVRAVVGVVVEVFVIMSPS